MLKASAISRVVVSLLFACTVPLTQAQPRWDYLGEANVDGRVDHDNIKVGPSRGSFRAIRLRVEIAAVRFDRVVVHYGNGSDVPISLRSRINPGGQTRVIDLPGDQRIIESVEFWYERASGSPDKPKVRLFGLH